MLSYPCFSSPWSRLWSEKPNLVSKITHQTDVDEIMDTWRLHEQRASTVVVYVNAAEITPITWMKIWWWKYVNMNEWMNEWINKFVFVQDEMMGVVVAVLCFVSHVCIVKFEYQNQFGETNDCKLQIWVKWMNEMKEWMEWKCHC